MSIFGSEFLLTLLGVNICLTYAIYPTALLGRMTVAPVAYMAIGAYASAYFTTRHMAFLPGWLIGMGLSVVLGLLLTAVAGHLRSHFYLAAALGVVLIVQQLAFSLEDLTGGYLGLSTPEGIIAPWMVWLLALLCVAGAASLRHSLIDRLWRAVGSDDHIAGALGISVRRSLLIAGTCGAIIAATAGAFYAHLIAFFDPNSFGLALLLNLVASFVLGGVAGWYGPLLGAVVMTILPEALQDIGVWRNAVLGAVLVVCVLFLPRGLSDWPSLAAGARKIIAGRRRA